MITLFEYHPNTGSPIELNDLNYPLHDFNIKTNIDVHDNKKLALPGQWPSFHYPDAMDISAEGDIVGSGATPTEDYVSKRIALMAAVIPPMQHLTDRKHGFVRIQLDGMTETADADVVIVDHAIPMQALYPAISPFMLQWKGFLPYFVGTNTSTVYILG